MSTETAPLSAVRVEPVVMLHPCQCKGYNGGQCYNCLNGAHDICDAKPKCRQNRDSVLGLPIVAQHNSVLDGHLPFQD